MLASATGRIQAQLLFLLPTRGTGLCSAHCVLKWMEWGDSFGGKKLELERELFSKGRAYLQIYKVSGVFKKCNPNSQWLTSGVTTSRYRCLDTQRSGRAFYLLWIYSAQQEYKVACWVSPTAGQHSCIGEKEMAPSPKPTPCFLSFSHVTDHFPGVVWPPVRDNTSMHQWSDNLLVSL